MEIWETQNVIYRGKIFNIRTGTVVLDDQTRAHREVVEHPGGVCIIPYHDGHVFLIQQFRIAVGEVVLEAPAGKIEAGDTPRTRAEAELEEETGFKAASWVDLGFVYSSVGYCSEKIYLFLALDLTFHGQRLEKDERIHTVRIPLERIKEDLRQGRINDAKTCVGLHRLLMHLKENP